MTLRNWLLVCMPLTVAVLTASPIYTVQDLGSLGGTGTAAFAVNNSGLAVGVSTDLEGYRRAISSMGPSPAALSGPGAYGTAAAVNDSGIVAGTVYVDGVAQATIWKDGVASNVGGANSFAMGINEAGQITGSINGHAFVTQDGTKLDLGTFAGGSWSAGYSVNNNGQVAGYAMRQNGTFQAFLWSLSTGLAAIDGLGGVNNYAMGVNDSGQVSGSAQVRSGYVHAFLSSNGTTRDLGTLGGGSSYGYGIDQAGDVVGYSWTGSGDRTHAFLYRDGVMVDLNGLVAAANGWILTEAYGINGLGQIVGAGWFDGKQHAFRLDPIASPSGIALQSAAFDAAPADVPEPSTTMLVLLPLAGLLGARAKRLLRDCSRR